MSTNNAICAELDKIIPELSLQGTSHEHPQHMVLWRNKKKKFPIPHITVKPQWLKHLWDHGNSFETSVVRATEG